MSESIKYRYSVRSIDSALCKEWLLYKHYAKRIPCISYSFGLYDRGNILQGVCTFGMPASAPIMYGICGEKFKDIVIELNRLVINDNVEKNTASFFVGRCIRLLPKPLIIISFADASIGHIGYIYQALNFIYTGLSEKRTDRIFIDGSKNKHGRHMNLIEVKNAKGRTVIVDRPRKHRYVYFSGNSKQKMKMINALNYKQQPYPKGDNKRYDSSYQPTIQTELF